jgi:hypothetical protein
MSNKSERTNMKQLVAVVERESGGEKKAFWTRIGVAFENRDGSWNLRFDFVPTRMGETTIQLRDFDPKEDKAS